MPQVMQSLVPRGEGLGPLIQVVIIFQINVNFFRLLLISLSIKIKNKKNLFVSTNFLFSAHTF